GQAVTAPPAAGPAQATPVPPAARLSFQGHFAGAVSRFLAYVTDVAVGTAVYTLAVAGAGFVVSVITSQSVSWNRANIVVEILYFAWMFLYFAYSWAASGRTLGMAALGVKVVSADGADASGRQAVIRTLAFPLSFLLFGLGFLGIVVQRDRRALHDLIAGTAVVYAWDARSARLRFLAREKPPAAG
ncbi:MAG: RDD family protein, partial [Streptosporangiales bacterium]